MIGPSRKCYIQSFVEIGPLISEKVLNAFPHIWVWRPSWSCDLYAANKTFVPSTHEGSTKHLALISQAVLERKIFENGGRRRTTTMEDNGRTPEHGYTIRSDGSGELNTGGFLKSGGIHI